MRRNAVAMRLNPGCVEEYKKRHDATDGELPQKDIMETNPDESPVSTPLKEVFHMD